MCLSKSHLSAQGSRLACLFDIEQPQKQGGIHLRVLADKSNPPFLRQDSTVPLTGGPDISVSDTIVQISRMARLQVVDDILHPLISNLIDELPTYSNIKQPAQLPYSDISRSGIRRHPPGVPYLDNILSDSISSLQRSMGLHRMQLDRFALGILGDQISRFAPIVVGFARRIAFSFAGQVPHNRFVDIRRQIDVISIPSGSMTDSTIVQGVVVARKNVVHRKMRSNIRRPRIALLSSPIVFEPAPFNSTSSVVEKFTSLRGVQRSERAFVRKRIKRLLRLSPDLVVTSAPMCGIAQVFQLICFDEDLA